MFPFLLPGVTWVMDDQPEYEDINKHDSSPGKAGAPLEGGKGPHSYGGSAIDV